MATYEKDVQGVRSYSQQVVPITSSAGALTIDLSKGTVFTLELTESITAVTYLNVPPQSANYVLFLTMDGNSYSITWSASGFNARFPGNVPPTLVEANGAVNILAFQTSNGGSTWSGFVGGLGFNYSVTPAAVNWSDISSFPDFTIWGYTTQRITNITTPITLSVNYAGTTQLYYKVDTTDPGDYNDVSDSDPATQGFTSISDTGTFSVNDGEWVSFGVDDLDISGNYVDSVTVTNTTDNNTVLDTFNATTDTL
jgi:hypothetical protein